VTKTIINPPTHAAPTGPPETPSYSWVVKRGNHVYLAGMLPYDSENRLVGDDLPSQTRRALENVRDAVEAAGGTMRDVCPIVVYTTKTNLLEDVFPLINPVFWEFFPSEPPARAVIGGIALPRGNVYVELLATAILEPA